MCQATDRPGKRPEIDEVIPLTRIIVIANAGKSRRCVVFHNRCGCGSFVGWLNGERVGFPIVLGELVIGRDFASLLPEYPMVENFTLSPSKNAL